MRGSLISFSLGAVDGDVAGHGVGAQLDQRRLALGRRIGDRELGSDVAAPRARVDIEPRAFLDPDADVAGGGAEVDAVLEDAVDMLVARRGVRADGREGFLDLDVAGGAVRL